MFPFSLRTKLTLTMIVIAVLVAGAAVYTSYWTRSAELLREFQQFVRSVAGTAATSLRGEDLSSIRANADAARPEFVSLRDQLEKVRKVNSLSQAEVYILRPVKVSPSRIVTEFVVMLQAKTFIGDRYEITEENVSAFREAWMTATEQTTGIYSDANGTWISGYSPILDQAGKPVAILEVDAEISRFLQRQQRDLLTSLGASAIALCVGLIPGLILIRQITGGLSLLSHGMRRFQAGDHGVQLAVRSRDEIGTLAQAFNEMIVSLGERLALLPFVSRFTANAVRRSRHDPDWLKGSERSVVVLFADLRGFTRFSENLAAPELVQQLNQILAVEAEVVLSMGGDVDKFVGDAVMALFFDVESPVEAALACAKEMLRRVQERVEQNGLDLALGIGIHTGTAVLGSIGAEVRRDCTAIGHTVNLASRLCDAAGRWQLLVSEDVLERISPDCRADFQETEPIRFKNVSQAVATYSWELKQEYTSKV